jgi:hypothetical protein
VSVAVGRAIIKQGERLRVKNVWRRGLQERKSPVRQKLTQTQPVGKDTIQRNLGSLLEDLTTFDMKVNQIIIRII